MKNSRAAPSGPEFAGIVGNCDDRTAGYCATAARIIGHWSSLAMAKCGRLRRLVVPVESRCTRRGSSVRSETRFVSSDGGVCCSGQRLRASERVGQDGVPKEDAELWSDAEVAASDERSPQL
ncbi:hypothetical protein NL676_032962 [Syzygium grande]|nr:hypothetical protein NL676_032962 [Syzygium grande]